ncbi:MAG: competence/damage-inducible protein A [Burkholderiaceae bacterium]|nr:competence/damage-inducible protein A [Burkholderiaceae bacterium]
MDIGLVIVGDEILSGKRQDKHLPKVIELLAARGLALAWARYVGDRRDRITPVLREAFSSGDLVFCCGGIGATPDDHTRQCAAEALGVPLVLHPQARALIEERMRDVAAEQGAPFEPDRPDNVQRLQMGHFPEGAQIVPNPFNKVPGFSIGHVSFVPGFPVMAHPMIQWVLDERYRPLHGTQAVTEHSVIVHRGVESVLTPLMEEVERRFPGVRVFSLPSVDHPVHGRHIELGVKGRAPAVDVAFDFLQQQLRSAGAELGTVMVR